MACDVRSQGGTHGFTYVPGFMVDERTLWDETPEGQCVLARASRFRACTAQGYEVCSSSRTSTQRVGIRP